MSLPRVDDSVVHGGAETGLGWWPRKPSALPRAEMRLREEDDTSLNDLALAGKHFYAVGPYQQEVLIRWNRAFGDTLRQTARSADWPTQNRLRFEHAA